MNEVEERLQDKFAGALLGTFVGDALGAPVEGWPPDRLRDTIAGLALLPARGPEREMLDALVGLIGGGNVAPGSARYTDDTQMTIGLAESLVAVGGFDGPDLARRFADNFEGHRGYGPGAYGVLRALKGGAAWNEVAGELFGGRGSFGNGAAMRASPVGVFYHRADEADELRRVTELQASVTHTHPLGKEGAVVQALAVAGAVRAEPGDALDPHDFLNALAARLPAGEAGTAYRQKLDDIGALLRLHLEPAEVADTLGNEITALESVPAALYAFLANSDSFAEAVFYAVSLGGDADTIGAMTGAIAGAYHGASAIPSKWLAALENGAKGRDYVQGLAADLFDSWRRWRATAPFA